MDADKIRNIAEEELAEGSLFLVEVNITPGNEIAVSYTHLTLPTNSLV